MPYIPHDKTKPLDLTGVELRERHGRQEAFCPSCGAWLLINDWYNGDRAVIRQLAHLYPCENYNAFIEDFKASRHQDAAS